MTSPWNAWRVPYTENESDNNADINGRDLLFSMWRNFNPGANLFGGSGHYFFAQNVARLLREYEHKQGQHKIMLENCHVCLEEYEERMKADPTMVRYKSKWRKKSAEIAISEAGELRAEECGCPRCDTTCRLPSVEEAIEEIEKWMPPGADAAEILAQGEADGRIEVDRRPRTRSRPKLEYYYEDD